MSVNRVILLGNLGKDPEVRYLDNNKVVAQLSLATSETYTDRNGEKKVDTEWHQVEMWDAMAKTAEKYLKKGMQVYIEGKIRTYKWRDKEGHELTGKKIRATSMTLLGGGQRGNEQESRTDSSSALPHGFPPVGSTDTSLTDDLPF
jgi:single-strand DNA-binding protein